MVQMGVPPLQACPPVADQLANGGTYMEYEMVTLPLVCTGNDVSCQHCLGDTLVFEINTLC